MDATAFCWTEPRVHPDAGTDPSSANSSTTPTTADTGAGSPCTSDGRSRKRRIEPEAEVARDERRASVGTGRRKASRACDYCKRRKIRCTGTLPCSRCTKMGLSCLYESSYFRGRPPTPPPSGPGPVTLEVHQDGASTSWTRVSGSVYHTTPATSFGLNPLGEFGNGQVDSQDPASRASPELEMAEIQGQVLDPTSGLSFLHRAWKRLSNHHQNTVFSDEPQGDAVIEDQPLLLAGDRPLQQVTHVDVDKFAFPDPRRVRKLLGLYFDFCIATYRMVHRASVETWLNIMEGNLNRGDPVWKEIGKAKAAIVLVALSIATLHDERAKDVPAQTNKRISLERSDSLFCVAYRLTEMETGLPKLESAQARLIQTIYLLMTSRSNLAWYTFGISLQIISTLGLHRRAVKKGRLDSAKADYIQAQCQRRTFWTSYILDTHLGMVFGRPRHFHDDDIDQEFPDQIEDEDMTAQGPRTKEQPDCLINALIFHAKIARIIGDISKEVYSIKSISEQERVAAAHRLSKEVHAWRARLPPYLGSVSPHMLATIYRRQSTVLKFAYYHAIIHANRLFLLGKLDWSSEPQVVECIGAARGVLEIVDGLAAEGSFILATWWIHYVTFCALVVSHVWDIQKSRRGIAVRDADEHQRFMDLAERCQRHLASATMSNSMSRRYAVVLEEFRAEVKSQRTQQDGVSNTEIWASGNAAGSGPSQQLGMAVNPTPAAEARDADVDLSNDSNRFSSNLLDGWETTDWLDLDSAAFESFLDFSGAI
ncbi:hypothetical protein ACJ41O_001814 [Fusarium nematophilum]